MASRQSGELCELCNEGHLYVYCAKRRDDNSMIRYLKCDTCGNTPDNNKIYVPPELNRRPYKIRKLTARKLK